MPLLCCLRLRDVQLPANLAREDVTDLTVTRYGRGSLGGAVDVSGMLPAFAEELAAVRLQMPDEVFALHAADSETDSRMTS